MSQIEAGAKLWMDHGKLSRIEQGQLPEVSLVREMLDLYGVVVNDWDSMTALWLKAKEKGWWREFGISNRSYVGVEHDACLSRNFELNYVPGILQTEAYMRALFGAARNGHSKQWTDTEVAVRLRRAQRLIDRTPLELRAVIDEHALRRKFGRKVMHKQLNQVLERAEMPNVTIQVVPDRGAYPGMSGSFSVLDYPDPAETGLAFVPTTARLLHLDDPEEVQECRLTFEHIAKLALSPEDSRVFIKQLVSDL